MHNELDRLAEIAFAREKGFAEGEVNKSVAIAKSMLADKMGPALIAKYTGLSEEKVRSLFCSEYSQK